VKPAARRREPRFGALLNSRNFTAESRGARVSRLRISVPDRTLMRSLDQQEP